MAGQARSTVCLEIVSPLQGGGFLNGYPQGVARGLALPWAILFEAFSLSNPQFAMPECGITLSNAECGTPECGIRLENMVPKVTLTKRCIQGLLFAPTNGAWRSSRRLVAINMSLLTELARSQTSVRATGNKHGMSMTRK